MCAENDVVIGWQAAAALAGTSVSTLRRRAAIGELHADQGEDGRYRLRRDELEQLRLVQSTSTGADVDVEPLTTVRENSGLQPPGEARGELAAAAFKLFREGRDPAEVVIALAQRPSVIRDLHREFTEMSGALLIPGPMRAELVSRLGELAGPEALFEAIEALLYQQFELRRFTYECSRCGKMIQAQADREWADVLEHGGLDAWHCGEC